MFGVLALKTSLYSMYMLYNIIRGWGSESNREIGFRFRSCDACVRASEAVRGRVRQ